MKKLGVLAVVLVAAMIYAPKIASKFQKDQHEVTAVKRVKSMLGAWHKGQGKMNERTQTAYCMWYAGKLVLFDRDMDRAIDGFIVWRLKKDLKDAIDSYEVFDAKRVPGDEVDPIFVVNAEIDGQKLSMVVQEGEPIRWR